MTKNEFPKGFLWGGAVAAHQLEGGWNKGGSSAILSAFSCVLQYIASRRNISGIAFAILT